MCTRLISTWFLLPFVFVVFTGKSYSMELKKIEMVSSPPIWLALSLTEIHADLNAAKIERVGNYYFVDINHGSGISDSTLYVFMEIKGIGIQVVIFPRKSVERKMQFKNNYVDISEKTLFKSTDFMDNNRNEWFHVASIKIND